MTNAQNYMNDENAINNAQIQQMICKSSLSIDSRPSFQSTNSSKLASKVFGVLTDDDVDGNSLSYSPSPLHDRKSYSNRILEKPIQKAFYFEEMEDRSLGREDSKDSVSSLLGSHVVEEAEKQLQEAKNKHNAEPRSLLIATKTQPITARTNLENLSVNQTLNSVRRAKIDAEKEKRQITAKIREERRNEKEEAAKLHEEAEETKRKIIELKKQISSKYTKTKVARRRAEQSARRGAITKELEFKSHVYRHHKKVLKEDEDKRRRISIDKRTKIRNENRAANHKLQMARIEEDQILIEERHMSSLAMQQSKKDEAERRRKSLLSRKGAACRIKEIHNEMEAKRLLNEHASYELKWAGEKDAEDYKKQTEECRRKSLHLRGDETKRQKTIELQMKGEQQHLEHESFELKWIGEKDAKEYEAKMEENKRKSLEFRNQEGKRQRELQYELESEKLNYEHQSYELKWAADKDVEAYKQQMDEDRRKSLAGRNEDGKRKRQVEDKYKCEQKQAEHLSYELKWAAEKDVEEFKNKVEQARRDSLFFRNQEHKLIRDVEAQIRIDELEREHESYELKWDGEKDAEAYKKKLKEDRRRSIEFRNEIAKRQRDIEDERKADHQRAEHESYELKWIGEKDVEEHKNLIREEKRDSLALRNEEARRKRDIELQIDAENKMMEHENYALKWQGEKDVEAYKQQLDKERRESIAFRNEEAKQQRDNAEQARAERQQEEHENYELKWAAQKDTEKYKREMAEAKRKSFEFRHKEGKRHRDIDDQSKIEKQLSEQESYELKRTGEKDVDKYKKQIQDDRRMSLEFRNEESRRQKDIIDEQIFEKKIEEHESYELKWAGERDVEEYEKQMKEARRKSRAFRNEEGKRCRDLELLLRQQEKMAEHESYELKWAGEKDLEAYERKISILRRESLALRNEESRIQRDVMNELHAIVKQKETESMVLKWAAENDVKKHLAEEAKKKRESLEIRNKEAKRHRDIDAEKYQQSIVEQAMEEDIKAGCQKDVEEYIEECKRRRRMSLASRAKQHRLHVAWDKSQAKKEIEQRHRDTQDNALDRKYIQLARDRERMRLALDALHNPRRTYIGNPFASLLD